MALLLLILAAVFLILFFLLVRGTAPSLGKLIVFFLLIVDGILLVRAFAIHVAKWDPNPFRFDVAHWLTKDTLIDLTQFVPGLAEDPRLIQRVDTDWEPNEDPNEEWLVFYRYDVATANVRVAAGGPYGAAIYDVNRCRPPAVQSYELAPVSYDYLGQDWVTAQIDNIIPYTSTLSGSYDRPEVIVAGHTLGVVTDLNIFRKEGNEPDCSQGQAWRDARQESACPYPVEYRVLGSFRGNYLIRRNGATVNVYDRAGFERSQVVSRKMYRPDKQTGSYFSDPDKPATLLPPVEFGLEFGPGWPDSIPQVYYPEKAVLAFYLSLTKDTADLERAKGYLSAGAQEAYDINANPFGLSTALDSVARARDDLARVLVWQIKYDPEIEEERAHTERRVTVLVVGVDKDGKIDSAHPCQVTWTIVGVPNSAALPYGCEWRLDRYQSTCSSGELGKKDSGDYLVSQASP
ncbi:MAG: hypothetical protein JXM73_02080 [Anaerolineae bacterium]|nr:hypothetical protein [Anaerolineae bacterium]